MTKINLCKAEEVPVGESLKITLEGRLPVAVFNLKGTFFVMDDTCSHAKEGSLSQGDIEDDQVICPIHWAAFHIPTGEARSFPASCPVNVYKTEVVDGAVIAEFDEVIKSTPEIVPEVTAILETTKFADTPSNEMGGDMENEVVVRSSTKDITTKIQNIGKELSSIENTSLSLEESNPMNEKNAAQIADLVADKLAEKFITALTNNKEVAANDTVSKIVTESGIKNNLAAGLSSQNAPACASNCDQEGTDKAFAEGGNNRWRNHYTDKKSFPEYARLVDDENGQIQRRIFWDDDIYQAELEQIFARCWLFLAHESQMPNKGDFVSTYMGEDSVIVAKQSDGSFKAFLNSCPHRGNRVTFADEGNAKGFVCNYHGWSFGLDGALNGMPQSQIYDATPGFDRCNHGLMQVAQIDTYKGLIFATFDPKAPSLAEYLGDFAYYLDIILDNEEGGTELIPGSIKSVLKTNWKFAADNFVGDIYHAEYTHDSGAKAILGSGVKLAKQHNAIQASVNGHGIETSMDKFGNTRTLGEPIIEEYFRARWDKIVDRLGDSRARMIGAISSSTIFPNFSFLPGQNTLRVWQPKGPHEIELHSWTIVNKNMPTEVKEAFRRGTMMTFSPAGVFEMDDGENWEYATRSNRGHITRKQSLCYTMGLGSGMEESKFPGIIHQNSLNDANQRLFYKRWANLMKAPSWKEVEND